MKYDKVEKIIKHR